MAVDDFPAKSFRVAPFEFSPRQFVISASFVVLATYVTYRVSQKYFEYRVS